MNPNERFYCNRPGNAIIVLPANLTGVIKKAVADIFHLLYPRLCPGCGNELGKTETICLSCIHDLPLTGFCNHAGNPVEKIFWGRLPVTDASAYLYFTKRSILQNLMHAFKYRGNIAVGQFLGRRMGEALTRSGRYNDIDAIVPLPLFYKKERKRGYNQAAVLSSGIAEITGFELFSDIIVRLGPAPSQTKRNREQRWQNTEAQFELRQPQKIAGKQVLLVDDVITTGATLESCGMELLKAPGLRLSIAALAYTSL